MTTLMYFTGLLIDSNYVDKFTRSFYWKLVMELPDTQCHYVLELLGYNRQNLTTKRR